ncbi:SPOR domain-containing protein [Kordiimonas aestuarii]|uniref:SPOR domain-containing protein n=1 Tax=Kordiimonas aestuarii TaxID=1005925 RepID=UPI0021D20BD3|nr:SPOR domain-containing protein [Kordiimonas aestuarii]
MKTSNTARRLLLGCAMLSIAACNGQNEPAIKAATPVNAGAQTGGILVIADDLAAKGDHSAAIPLYRHQATATGSPTATTGLARSLAALGKYDEAENILEGLALRSGLSGEGWYVLGKSRIALGKFDTALLAFDSAATTMPSDPGVISARGITLAALGRTGDAIAAFRHTADPGSLSNLALIFAMTGNAAAAVNILEPLALNGKVSAQGRQNLAMAYLLAGRETDAYQMARLDLDPASVGETFTFYRSLTSLPVDRRMQALTTGIVEPDWTNAEAGNLVLAEKPNAEEAAKRIAARPVLAKVPAPVKQEPVKQEAKTDIDVANYELTEIPPLVEPNGWALQIGAYRTTKALMRGWTILYRANVDLLTDIPPRRSEVDFGNTEGKPKGFYYRLNAGPLKSLGAARTLCQALKARGTECWIRPPEKSEGRLPDSARKPASGSAVTTASVME